MFVDAQNKNGTFCLDIGEESLFKNEFYNRAPFFFFEIVSVYCLVNSTHSASMALITVGFVCRVLLSINTSHNFCTQLVCRGTERRECN